MPTATKKKPAKKRASRPAAKSKKFRGGVLEPTRPEAKPRKRKTPTRADTKPKAKHKGQTNLQKSQKKYLDWIDDFDQRGLDCKLSRRHQWLNPTEYWILDDNFLGQKLHCACGMTERRTLDRETMTVVDTFDRQVPKYYQRPKEASLAVQGPTPVGEWRARYWQPIEPDKEDKDFVLNWLATYR